MYDELVNYCRNILSFTSQDLILIEEYFEECEVPKKNFLLIDNTICNFIGFIAKGSIRHFHIKNGVEKTCDISFENSWVTDFQSFTKQKPSTINLQAMENTLIYRIKREALYELYNKCQHFETLGRIIIENILHRSTELTISLSSSSPEERFINLIKERPDLFQRVPQKYIANLLGIAPESLSRIRNRIIKNLKT